MIVGVVALGSIAGFFYWRGQPSYALARLVAAVENKDLATVNRYVDVPRVVDAAVEDMVGMAMGRFKEAGSGDAGSGERKGSGGALAALGAALGTGFAAMMKPELQRRVRDELEKFRSPFPGYRIRSVAKVVKDGEEHDKATFRVVLKAEPPAPAGAEDLAVELEMAKTDGWRVVRVANLPVVLAALKNVAASWLNDLADVIRQPE